ncbi:MAG: ABC transporter ATP-binding protein [Syntrophales bacterium]|nr:ABC transporter ATP-binding protein [Syntrophales bacterium]
MNMRLRIENLEVKYGNVRVLKGLNIRVEQGEIVTILGANGAGKSTTLMTVSGLVKPSGGGVYLDDVPLHKLEAHHIVNLGLAQVPEGRRVFGTLTVLENLRLGAYTTVDKALVGRNLGWVFEMFPILNRRSGQLAGTLSGGEQQMLAIGRGLMANPKILLLDEPSLGLAPILVKSIFSTIKAINRSGVTIVLVEQNARLALKLADRGYVLETGRIVLEDKAEALLANPEVQNAYLGGMH